jgi:adenylate cyclase
MATWGTRGDQPDHAALAVRAAAAVQAQTARIGDQQPDWPRFRIAVNSGEALVGVVGAESGRSYTVIGDTVNVAARLQTRAPTGGVVLSGATLRGVPGLHATSLGEIEVRGKREVVDAYLLETHLR